MHPGLVGPTSTDPRTPSTVAVDEIPGLVGGARVACAEVGIACRDVRRTTEGTALAHHAERLHMLATRLGQAATALSAVPLRVGKGQPVEVLVWVAPRLPLIRRVRHGLAAFWRVLRG